MQRWLFPVLIATACLIVIVKTRNVHGCGVRDANESETPTMSEDGVNAMDDNSAEIEAKSASLQQSAEELRVAIQKHIANMYGNEVVTDWMICAEVLTDGDDRGLRLALSPDMTSWKLLGMSHTMNKYILMSNA